MTDSKIKKPVPTHHFRRVGVFVDEPQPGQFYWVIIESKDDASVWIDLRTAEESFSSWFAAWEMGNKELLKMVVDKKTGPLAPSQGENASPVGG